MKTSFRNVPPFALCDYSHTRHLRSFRTFSALFEDLRLRAIFLGTAVGTIPWALFYSLVGNSGKSLLQLSSSSAKKAAIVASSKTPADLAAFTSERIVDALSRADKLVPKVLTGLEMVIVGIALVLTLITAGQSRVGRKSRTAEKQPPNGILIRIGRVLILIKIPKRTCNTHPPRNI